MLAAVNWNWNCGLSQHAGGARGVLTGHGGVTVTVTVTDSDSHGRCGVFGCDFQPILHRRGREWEEEE